MFCYNPPYICLSSNFNTLPIEAALSFVCSWGFSVYLLLLLPIVIPPMSFAVIFQTISLLFCWIFCWIKKLDWKDGYSQNHFWRSLTFLKAFNISSDLPAFTERIASIAVKFTAWSILALTCSCLPVCNTGHIIGPYADKLRSLPQHSIFPF